MGSASNAPVTAKSKRSLAPYLSSATARSRSIGITATPPVPNVLPLFGDFTQIEAHHVGPVDLLSGGTPCQAFSVAGKRLGLDDPRGNLTLEFLALARRLRVEWLVWENVPGFLSHDEGRTMGTFLRLLGELGYGWAYRVLDAQYIRVDGHEGAVPQRRRRLFVVGHLGDSAGPAAVLFERESLRGDSAPRREAGKGIAPVAAYGISPDCFDRSGEGAGGSAAERSGLGVEADLAYALRAKRPGGVAFGGGNTTGSLDIATAQTAHGQRLDFDSETFVMQAGVTRENPDSGPDGVGVQTGASYTLEARAETQIVATPYRVTPNDGAYATGDVTGSLTTNTDKSAISLVETVAHSLRAEGFDASEDGTGRGTPIVPVAYDTTHITSPGNWSNPQPGDPCHPITRTAHVPLVTYAEQQAWAVRRLTPTECERLMGVPDGFHGHHLSREARRRWTALQGAGE